jgi:hypothetical protein
LSFANRAARIERDWSAASTPLQRAKLKRAGHFTGPVLLDIEAA